VATSGHFRGVASVKHIHFFDTHFQLLFSDITSHSHFIFSFKKEIQNVSERSERLNNCQRDKLILIGTDCDREGEAIAHFLADLCPPHLSPKRILFNEISQRAITHAIQNPTTLNPHIFHAYSCRVALDLLIGHHTTSMLNKFLGTGWKRGRTNKKNMFTAGRCQSVALRLIYDAHIESLSKPPTAKYSIHAYFFEDYHIPFQFSKQFDTQNKEVMMHFLHLSKTHPHKLIIGDERTTTTSAPRPLNTAKILQLASQNFRYSPKTTMSILQKLYQGGKITYFRTENTRYSKDFIDSGTTYIDELFRRLSPQLSRSSSYTFIKADLASITNDILNTHSNHEAIRVTQLKNIPTDDSPPLYKLIWKISVQSLMSDAYFRTRILEIDSPLEGEIYSFKLDVPLWKGWKLVDTVVKDLGIEAGMGLENWSNIGVLRYNEEEEGGGFVEGGNSACENKRESIKLKKAGPHGFLFYVQSLKDKRNIVCNGIECTYNECTTQKYYSESSLIRKLEELKIGRPSTYSIFVNTIQDRGYVTKKNIEGRKVRCEDYLLRNGEIKEVVTIKTFASEKNKLVIEAIGIECIEFLIEHYDSIFNYEYTRKMEEELDRLVEMKDDSWELCCDVYNKLTKISKSLKKIKKAAYPIDERHDFVFRSWGGCIRRNGEKEGEEPLYLPLKKSFKIDLDALKRGDYRVSDMVEYEEPVLGEYEPGVPLFIKSGEYGCYLEWGGDTLSLKNWERSLRELNLIHAKEYIHKERSGGSLADLSQTEREKKKIYRIVDEYTQIRLGKFGMYLYHQTPHMSKPEFVSLKKFKGNFLTCETKELTDWMTKKSQSKKKLQPKDSENKTVAESPERRRKTTNRPATQPIL